MIFKSPVSIKKLLRMSVNELLKMSDLRASLGSKEATDIVYKKFARESNKRMRALEKLSEQDEYATVKKFAYARAQEDIRMSRGDKYKRFGMNVPVRESEAMDDIMDMKTFLKSPTSTVEGIETHYMKSAATLNERYGTNFKWDDMATFFESRFYKKMEAMGYDSKQIVKAIGVMQEDPEKFLKLIKESVKDDIKLPDKEGDAMTNRLIEDLVNEYGNSLGRYLKKIK